MTGWKAMMSGLTAELIEEISASKKEPTWMRDFRLECLQLYKQAPLPAWMPDISGLDLDKIVTYVRPGQAQTTSWEQVPAAIRQTFSELGIPQAEEKFLAGVSAQYDSELIYHRVQELAAEAGVYYSDLETALQTDYEPVIRQHFMKLITPQEHKFAALHGAVWSGGSFVYVPAEVELTLPLQSYFRLNAKGAGQFEHTLIILEPKAKLHFIEGCSAPRYNVASLHAGAVELLVGVGAKLRYSTIENWSKNMYNLNTKRAQVAAEGEIEWVSGSFGSAVTCLYPESILAGERAKSSFLGVTVAGAGQYLDTGAKVRHQAAGTTSVIRAKSIVKNGGSSVFRSSVTASEQASESKSFVACDSLILDEQSRADTLPAVVSKTTSFTSAHEARVGRISEETLAFLQARGLSEEAAVKLVVNGFVDNFARELPLEYAVEMNNLLNLEMQRKPITGKEKQ